MFIEYVIFCDVIFVSYGLFLVYTVSYIKIMKQWNLVDHNPDFKFTLTWISLTLLHRILTGLIGLILIRDWNQVW